MRSDKWWYRLLQVVYIVFICFLLLVVAGLAIAYVPEFSPYSSRYQFVCDDGTRHGNFPGSDLSYSRTEFVDISNQELARLVCSRPDLSGEQANAEYKKIKLAQAESGYTPVAEPKSISYSSFKVLSYSSPEGIPAATNYRIEILQKEYYGSWWVVASIVAVGLLLTVVLASLVRAIFLYVAFKERFFRKLFFRR